MLLTAIILFAISSGCVDSANDEIDMAVSLMNSGSDRIGEIDLEKDSYSTARAKYTASEADYEEALKILNSATTDTDDEKKSIKLYTDVCEYTLEYIKGSQKLLVALEHSDKFGVYFESDDLASAKTELKLAEDALDEATPLISIAKQKSSSIEAGEVPVEMKSVIIEDKLVIEQDYNDISDVQEMFSAMHPLIEGFEHMQIGNEYIENEEWKKAEFEFNKSYEDISKSKEIFVPLMKSESTETSVLAIEMNTILTETLDALIHLETGCRYASENNFNKAYEEFDKIE